MNALHTNVWSQDSSLSTSTRALDTVMFKTMTSIISKAELLSFSFCIVGNFGAPNLKPKRLEIEVQIQNCIDKTCVYMHAWPAWELRGT